MTTLVSLLVFVLIICVVLWLVRMVVSNIPGVSPFIPNLVLAIAALPNLLVAIAALICLMWLLSETSPMWHHSWGP